MVSVKFVGFWPEFDINNNFIVNTLKKYDQVVNSEKPQYLFVGPFSDEYLEYDCIRVFYTGENMSPDFSLFDYAIGFDYIDFGDRYIRFPNWAIPEIYGDKVNLMKRKHLLTDESAVRLSKRKFCSFVVSKGNGYVCGEREQIFYLLSEYRKVDSGGRFLNNIGYPEGVADKLEFQRKYKFAIAAENSSQPGYTTEKIVDAFAAMTVPIYFGDPLIAKEFNTQAFINLGDCDSFSDALEKVKQIDQDEKAYTDMLRQPALCKEIDYENRLSEFLYNIIKQPYEQAFRRDRIGYNKKKEDNLKKLHEIEKSHVYKFVSRLKK